MAVALCKSANNARAGLRTALWGRVACPQPLLRFLARATAIAGEARLACGHATRPETPGN